MSRPWTAMALLSWGVCLLVFGSEALAQRPPAPATTPASAKVQRPKSRGPRALLRAALGLYVQGHYQQAAARLAPLVQKRVLADRADRLEALRTYGIALFLGGARPAAERAFRELLRLDPKARLDPDFVKPECVRFFAGVKRRYRRELDAVVQRSAPKGSAVVNLLPPWGQLQNGHRSKAWWLLGGLAVTAAVSIATAAAWYGMRNHDGTFDVSDGTANGLQVSNLVAAGLFAGLYLYGVVDGLIYYFRHRRARLTAPSTALDPRGLTIRF